MTISTSRLYQTNRDLFVSLNKELQNLQAQAGSGEANLRLAKDLTDISKLNMLEEKSSEVSQYVSNAKRAQTDLEILDLTVERLQDLTIKLQEISVESTNDTLLPEERARFILDVQMIKDEIFSLANKKDSLGNSLFAGVANVDTAYNKDRNGVVSYQGSTISRKLNVSEGLEVKQNFSGLEVFDRISGEDGDFSVFTLIDKLTQSLEVPIGSYQANNLLANSNSAKIKLPPTEDQADLSFEFIVDGMKSTISASVFSNDYQPIVDKINQLTIQTGVSASLSENNQITFAGNGEDVTIGAFTFGVGYKGKPSVKVLNAQSNDIIDEIYSEVSSYSVTSQQITGAFEHFSSIRAEISNSFRLTEAAQQSNEDMILLIEEDIAELREADMASILTQIEFLMTNKEAAQATFTRISSKSLFDFLG